MAMGRRPDHIRRRIFFVCFFGFGRSAGIAAPFPAFCKRIFGASV
jgi:hypothetical protein